MPELLYVTLLGSDLLLLLITSPNPIYLTQTNTALRGHAAKCQSIKGACNPHIFITLQETLQGRNELF